MVWLQLMRLDRAGVEQIDMAIYLTYSQAMKTANIADLKDHLSQYLAYVQKGEVVEIAKRNVPIARLVPVQQPRRNQTKIGNATGAVQILGDLTEPLIPLEDWEMLKGEGPL